MFNSQRLLILAIIIGFIIPKAYGVFHVKEHGISHGMKWEIIYDYDGCNGYGVKIDGEIIIPPCSNQYVYKADENEKTRYIEGGLYFVVHKVAGSTDDNAELYDSKGNIVLPCKFELVKTIHLGNSKYLETVYVKKDYQREIYDYQGNLILPMHKYLKEFILNGIKYYKLERENINALYDSEFNCIVHFDDVSRIDLKEGSNFAILERNSTSYLYNLSTKEKIQLPPSYSYCSMEANGNVVKVKKDGRYGLYDLRTKHELISPDFEDVSYVDGVDFIIYKFNGFWGVMNLTGKEIIPTTRGYTSISYNKALKKFAYTKDGYKGECNRLGAQLSKIAVKKNDNATNSGEANARATKTTQGSSSSNHYASESSSATSSSDNQPKASGTYTISQQGRSLTTGNYTGVAGSDMTVTIEFYDDYITVNGLMCEYAGESNGRKRYDDPMQFAGSSTTYYVDANYNVQKQMTLSTPFGTDWFDYTVVKGNVSIPKAEPYHAPNNNLDGYSTGSSNGNGNRTTRTYQKDCPQCRGLGKCWTCNGSHRYVNPLTNEYVTCPNCGPDGRCRACGGTGKK